MTHDPDAEVRQSAIKGLGRLGERGATAEVVERLLELNACSALGKILGATGTPAEFDRLIQEQSDSVLDAMILEMAKIGRCEATPRMVDRLLERVGDPLEGEYMSKCAGDDLGRLCPPSALPEVLARLLSLARADDERLRRAGIHALGCLGGRAAVPEVLSTLLESVGTDDSGVCCLAGRALGWMGEAAVERNVLPRLLQLTHDARENATGSAIYALSCLGEAGAIPGVIHRLLELAHHPRFDDWSVVALGHLGERAARPRVQARLLELTYPGEGNTARRWAPPPWTEFGRAEDQLEQNAVNALGHLYVRRGSSAVVARLLELSRGRDALGSEALAALAKVGEPSVAVLTRLVEVSGDPFSGYSYEDRTVQRFLKEGYRMWAPRAEEARGFFRDGVFHVTNYSFKHVRELSAL